MKKHRCIWTNRQSERVKEVKLLTMDRLGRNPREKSFYVLPGYEQKLIGFNDFLIRYKHIFLRLVFGLPVIPIVLVPFAISGFISGPIMVFIGGGVTMLIGCTILFFPLATPETVGMFGLKKSIQIVRILGVVVVLLGAGTIGLLYLL